MTHCLRVTTLIVALAAPVFAQAPQPAPPPQAPPTAAKPAAPVQAPPETAKPPAAPAGQRATPRPAPATTGGAGLAVQVTDKSGNAVADVAVAVSGPVERSGRTSADGAVAFRALRVGTYRLRFEHEGFITLERELMVGTRTADVIVALNPAPPPKVVQAPPPPVAPAPAPQTRRAIEPRTLSIPDFVEKNLIGSEPQKSSLLACSDGGTTRILQVKEPMTNQVNADADQILYVVAGSGIVRVRDQDYKATPGWFVVIPRGVPLGARRDGRNPLITLTVTMGAACTESGPLAK